MLSASKRFGVILLHFKGYMNLPKLFHTRSNISELIKNITVETEYFVSALSAFQKVILELVMLITITIFLFFIDFKTTLYCSLILFIFSVAIYNFNTKVLSQMGKDRSKYVQSRLKTIYEGLLQSTIIHYLLFILYDYLVAHFLHSTFF